ncbi:hypothetical protein RhiirA5_494100 [Rhizophagus irregularis]|uniref:MARVEL domain-containing protein n=1 Tax=Rhizophagus irregularis TaxID=588596 RepID=A0A2I1E7Q5_9GLOM|nr:hypothetical protein RhiirA5_494100 [Rhizophagus irregularis]GBC42132.1 hypothetical protein GLOIN_2v49876 [Rhizophagus irregularis DAOM 181602=DAOM 197198]PKC69661.1 hypothetical protein RhiirA1_533286 [Rhizophagus irregularis]PKY18126.1 hypothetical protein RhiirB3_522514 [Rhizophagus irregularis]PKY39911.1 hypothetical protein RhiirA4_538439 [Rhizophagus irregularis]
MGLDKHPILFKSLRLLTIVVTLAIIALEITEHKKLSLFTQNSGISIEDYQSIKSNLFGIKIFFYIVIIITTIVKGIQFFKFNTLWREGPFVRDIVFGIGFSLLWIVAGLTNIYTFYYAPEVICPGYFMSNLQPFSSKSEIPWELQLKCKSYLSITALAWFNVLIFLLSTILYWKLWIDKRDNQILINELF